MLAAAASNVLAFRRRAAEPPVAEALPEAALCIVWNGPRLLTVTNDGEQAIPGGTVEPGEDPGGAAVREVAEECGVGAIIAEDVHFDTTSPTDGRSVCVYVADSFHGEPRALEPDTRVEWMTPDELLEQSRLYTKTLQELAQAGLLTPPSLKAKSSRSNFRFAAAISIEEGADGVERAGPGKAPTAIRLFKAGDNVSDEGTVRFTRKSARLVMAEFEARARLYSADYDHLSLMTNRPATAGKASAWYKLGLREDAYGEPELWAEGIDWTEEARAGLEKDPPEWRYFSPAFLAPPEGNSEVTSFMNFALCINPLTHELPSLAAAMTEVKPMFDMKSHKSAMLAAYERAMSPEASEESRRQGHEELARLMAELPVNEDKPAEESPEKGIGNEGGEKKEPPKEGRAPESPGYGTDAARKKAAGGPEDKGNEWPQASDKPATAKPEDHAGEKTETRAAVGMAHELRRQGSEIEDLKRTHLLEKHPELSDSVRAWCATQPFSVVESFLKAAPTKLAARGASVTQGADAGQPMGLQGAEKAALDAAMGIGPSNRKQFERIPVNEGGGMRLHTMRPSDARALAAKEGR